MLSNVVVTGGGTGGHVFTGIAVLDEVRRRNPSARTTFLGSAVGHESTLVPRSGHASRTIDVRPLRLNGVEGAARALTRIPAAVIAAGKILRELQPEVVLGVGGAASGPALIAARLLGLRTLLHEQNAVPGLANRLSGGFVEHILVGLPQVRGRFVARPGVVLTGNPVRAELLATLTHHTPRRVRGTADDPINVLVLGGSDGSLFLNSRGPLSLWRAIEQACAQVEGLHVRVLHQAGVRSAKRIAGFYERIAAEGHGAGRATRCSLSAEVKPFLDDMGAAYREADLAVALAGAGTLGELSLAGVPSIVVPLTTSADDHQRENAYHFARHGGISLIDQRDWERDDSAACAEIARLLLDADAREALSARFRRLATPGAAAAIVDQLERR